MDIWAEYTALKDPVDNHKRNLAETENEIGVREQYFLIYQYQEFSEMYRILGNIAL